MKAKDIHKTLNGIYPLTDEAWLAFSALLEPAGLEKSEYLVREGGRVHHAYFLEEGLILVFYNKDGNEYNKTFFIPGMFPTPITALLSDAPCQLNFQALLPCRLFRFPYRAFRELFPEHRCLESMMLRLMEYEWMKKELHDIRMVTNDATSNYMIFREEYPELENLIPQYHIASYLGVTPIQLSRIRARLAQPN